jgi:hypothetical protein
MPKTDSVASALAPILDDSTAGELIPELMRHGLQQLIELEVAGRHERTDERLGYRNGSSPGLLLQLGPSVRRWFRRTLRRSTSAAAEPERILASHL